MTRNQLEYMSIRETSRANQAREAETARANRAQEAQTAYRDEMAVRQRDAELAEQIRSALVREDLTAQQVDISRAQHRETVRSNQAREAETFRSNLARETETSRANKASEAEARRANFAREAETHRSNVARETETFRSNFARETETARANRAAEAELLRSHQASEEIGRLQASAALTQASAAWQNAQTRERELASLNVYRAQTVQLQANQQAEQQRHNIALEDVSRTDAATRQYQAETGRLQARETERYNTIMSHIQQQQADASTLRAQAEAGKVILSGVQQVVNLGMLLGGAM